MLLTLIVMLLSLAAIAQAQCPAGTLGEPGGECLPVVAVQIPYPHVADEQPPDLAYARRWSYRAVVQSRADRTQPRPGGIGAGTTYDVGKLRATLGATLTTNVYVWPDGLPESNSNLTWLYLTASNRTQFGAEGPVLLYPAGKLGQIGVYDWSCSVTWPCVTATATYTAPAWVWTSDMLNFACDITTEDAPDGHVVSRIKYINETVINTTTGWTNAIFLRNFCYQRWDRVYKHKYGGAQKDCSADNSCAWWGPIIETFLKDATQPLPKIDEVGFQGASLVHNGYLSDLLTDATTFTAPSSPWKLFFLAPNNGYGVGNYY